MTKKKTLIGRKIGMTRIFDEQGGVTPVTVIEAGPCHVTQIKTEATDGYDAVQIGFEHAKKLSKPERGHLGQLPSLRHLREFRTSELSEYELGQVLTAGDLFAAGDKVDVRGVSKGRGFAGAVKRHGFRGGPKTHGQSDRHRAVGSIGATTTPGRVFKGMRGPGHMGNEQVTVLNLEIVKVDAERHLIAVKGAVPGPDGGLVIIRNAVKL
ncbi:MAG: 50S ribosomal protein L3 [Chloroflexi bacterium]|jgi:large subunit ribosomal protein L3|nr:50S ribosomal protein L3 [Chloroflexota bacterium]